MGHTQVQDHLAAGSASILGEQYELSAREDRLRLHQPHADLQPRLFRRRLDRYQPPALVDRDRRCPGTESEAFDLGLKSRQNEIPDCRPDVFASCSRRLFSCSLLET
jgi:hypothetical protein